MMVTGTLKLRNTFVFGCAIFIAPTSRMAADVNNGTKVVEHFQAVGRRTENALK